MTAHINIRHGTHGDTLPIRRLFWRAVRRGTRAHYTFAERLAWCPGQPSIPAFRDRLQAQTVLVAEKRPHTLTGFITCDADGYIDLAFIDPDYQGLGIGGMLLDTLLAEARLVGQTEHSIHASKAAIGLFLSRGFTLIEKEFVPRRGQKLERYLMERHAP